MRETFTQRQVRVSLEKKKPDFLGHSLGRLTQLNRAVRSVVQGPRPAVLEAPPESGCCPCPRCHLSKRDLQGSWLYRPTGHPLTTCRILPLPGAPLLPACLLIQARCPGFLLPSLCPAPRPGHTNRGHAPEGLSKPSSFEGHIND